MSEQEQFKAGFEKVIRKYGDTVYYIALLHTKNNMDAQDIVQEVFLKYAENTKPFESEEHVKAWLIRVAINMCTNLSKSSWVTKTTELNDAVLPAGEFPYDDNGVSAAVKNLPEKYRNVIHLFYFEGYSIKEIGEITSQNISAVKVQLSRARKLLKNTLREEFGYGL